MSGQSNQVIEYIDGSIPIIRDDYHKETDQILRELPKATEHPVLPSDETLVENMKNNYNDYEKVVEIGNRLIEQKRHQNKESNELVRILLLVMRKEG